METGGLLRTGKDFHPPASIPTSSVTTKIIMTGQIDFNYGNSSSTTATKLIIDEKVDPAPKGCKAVVVDVLPPTVARQLFENYQIASFHRGLMTRMSAFIEAVNNTREITECPEYLQFVEAFESRRDVTPVLAATLDGLTDDAIADRFATEHLLWGRFHGVVPDEASAEKYVDILSKRNTLHSFNTVQLGKWIAAKTFKSDADGKKNFKYVGNPELEKFFSSRTTKMHEKEMLAEPLKDAPMTNDLKLKITEFNKVLDPAEWDDVTDALERGEQPDGVIEPDAPKGERAEADA